MRHEENKYETSSAPWSLPFVLGGLIGAAVALLFAPKSGRQTREKIKDTAQDAKERAGTYYDQARGKISTAMQKGAAVFQRKKAEMESKVDEAKEAYQASEGGTTV